MSRPHRLAMHFVLFVTTFSALFDIPPNYPDVHYNMTSSQPSQTVPAMVSTTKDICLWSDAPGPVLRVSMALTATNSTDDVPTGFPSSLSTLSVDADGPSLSTVFTPFTASAPSGSSFWSTLLLIWKYWRIKMDGYLTDFKEDLEQLAAVWRGIVSVFLWFVHNYGQVDGGSDGQLSDGSSEEWLLLLAECIPLVVRLGQCEFVRMALSLISSMVYSIGAWLFDFFGGIGSSAVDHIRRLSQKSWKYLSDNLVIEHFRHRGLRVYYQSADYVHLVLWMRNRTPRFAHDAHVVALGELIAGFLVRYQRTQWRTVARAAVIDALQVADTSRTEVSDTTALDGDGISGTELVEPDCNEETRPSQLYGSPVDDPPVTDSFDAKVEENGDDIAAEPDVAIDSHIPVADQTFGDKETATPELLYDDDSDDEVENELLQAPGTPMAQGLPDIPPAIEDTSGELENLYEKSLQSIGIIYLEDLCDGLKTPVSVTPTAIEDGTEDHLGEAMAYFLQLTAEQSLIDEAQDPSTSEVMETVGLEKTPNVDEEDSPSLPQDVLSDANSPLAKDAEPIALVEDDTEISGTIMPDVETVNMEHPQSDEEEGASLGEDGPVKEKALPDILVYDEARLQQEDHEEEAHQEEYSPFASFITGEEPQAHHAMTMGFMDDNIPEEAIEGDSYLGTGPVMAIGSGEPRTAYCRIPLLVRSVQLGEIDRRRPGVPSGAQNTSVRIPGTPEAWVPEVVGFNVETCDYLEEIFAAIDCYWFDQPNGNQYWQQRKFVISWLRRAIRGYSYEGFKEALADGLAENQRARFKRTVMALQPLHQHPVLACATAALYGELAVALGNRFGEFAEEVILILLALRGSPFAALAEEAQATVTKILKNVKAFDPQAFIPYLLDRDLTRLCTSNSVEGRRHVLAHLRTILVWHRESARIRLTSNIKLIQEVEDAIMAGLRDEDKALQSIAVDCYWAFTTTWPVRGKLLRVWLNPRISAMLDERKELSCALDAREESSKVVPQLVVQMPAGEEFKPLETTELWEGVIPFPSRRGTGTRRRTDSNFLGPFPWITQRELETE